MIKYFYVVAACLAANITLNLINPTNVLHAQTLEPRAYSNAPVGLNFLLAGYQHSYGALLFDPAVPITDASTNTDVGLLAYVRTLNVAGKSAKAGVILPYASLYAEGLVNGNFRTRQTRGAADPTFYFSINFYGAPALSLKDYKNYQQDTIIGFTFKLTAPLGAYDSDKAINIGTNRWTLEPGFGISKALGNWRLEASIAADFYTDNNDFFNGKKRQQETIYSSQFHVTYSLPRNIWVALSTTYYAGGRSTVDGTLNNDLQQNWRTGFTLALPVNRYNSIKIYGSNGVSARTGSNYDLLGVAWQHRWGAGL
jgi:hypothetical protein